MKKFLMLWVGELVSSIGSGMSNFALGVYIYKMTESATAVSLFTLFAFLPTVLLNPIGGVLADRFDRRLMMICGDLFSALGLLYILICMQTGSVEIWQIYIGVTVSATFVSLLGPAYKATVTDLLTEDEFAKASGLVQLASSAKFLISPAAAGFILVFADVRLILLIDIATLFVTVFTILLVRKGMRTVRSAVKAAYDGFHPVKALREGWNAVTGDMGIRVLVGLMALVCFYVGFLQTLLAPMILSFSDSKTLGIIQSVSAVGILIGSVIISVLGIKKNYVNILSNSLIVIGLFMAGMGLTTNIYVIIGTGLMFFLGLPFATACADTLARLKIPNELQGRAWGFISVLSQAGYLVAYAVSGVLADYVFGPLLMNGGLLAQSIGLFTGTGKGRGIGFMLIIAGLSVVATAVLVRKAKPLRNLENHMKNYTENVQKC
ncbi:MFS transporter [Anaerobacterium chartisolvens]|uniref:MFS transporter n=1 Tax=Anaerobacterium chartisolvens TaxID=1297424 RepID=A0A369BB46_9FIRM|nr:MFS transporter [Anaerobacterium chartisolvens]RCX18750.1 MFS transporter [Anaerobacterium chartisolvens]